MDIDLIGNLTSKSDVGTYSYPSAGQPKPHGVTSISGAITTSFTYDAKGNMTAGNGLTVSYASYNKPASITRGTTSIFFSDDPEHQRFKQIAPGGSTLYLGSGGALAEKFTGSGGAVTWTNYLVSAGGLVGMHVENVGGSTLTRYFHKDHLGSIAVISNESGTVLERLSYDAWGKRRYSNGADDPAGAIASQTNRGFTGHEELDNVGLVHMNGRVYDPLLARFGTPDPTTESPFSTQGWNRYSYVGNSPLNFTDPSGYCFMGCFWQSAFRAVQNLLRAVPILGTIVQIAAGALCTTALAPVCVGLAAAIITGITSGNLGMALRAGFISAVTAYAFTQVGNMTGSFVPEGGVLDPSRGGHGPLAFMSDAHLFNIAGHALVGCGSAVASGRRCGPGALSGAAGSFAGPLLTGLDFEAKLVATSVVGGAASVAGGGKFANGAITAAFGYLFNEVGLACRGIASTGNAASHCGLFVFDRNGDDLRSADIRAQFSLGRDQTRFNTEFETWSDDRQTFWSGNGFYRIAPQGMTQEAFEAAVIRDGDSYRASSYSIWGPNSNSAAAYPLIVNGAELPAVREGWAYGAQALRYWQDPQNWPLP